MQNKLKHNDTKSLILTLREKRNNFDTGQLFKLMDPASDWSKTFVQNTNLTNDKNRYDEFEVTVTGSTSEDRTNGIIHIPKEIGDLRYEVYEQTSGSTNLDVSATTENKLESGYIKLENDGYTGITSTKQYDEPSDSDKTYYV